MNFKKIKSALSLKNNDLGVNILLIGLPLLITMLADIILVTYLLEDIFFGAGNLLFGILSFLSMYLFVSVAKYHGVKITLQKWLTYGALIIIVQAGLILISDTQSILSLIVMFVLQIAIFAKLFKVKFEKAFNIMITISLIELAVSLVVMGIGIFTWIQIMSII